MSTFKIKNWQGSKIIQEVKAGIESGLFAGGSHILNESNNIAPIDQGPLTQTAGVAVDGQAGKANIYYVQKYAARLHEHPGYNFQHGRQGKWLEKTMLSSGEQAQQLIAQEIKRRLGG